MMIMATVALAGLAAFLIIPGRHGPRLLRRLESVELTSVRPVSRSRRWLALIPLAIAIECVALLLAGGRGLAYATVGMIIVGLALRMIGAGTRRRQANRAQAEIAGACRVLAAELRVGKVPGEALAAAAADHAVLAEAARVDLLGGDVVRVWRAKARSPGHSGLLDLARGWQLCQATGAPLSTVLDQISDNLMSDHATRMMVAGELAAPRASGKIMAVLPLLGIGLGYLIGGDPVRFLWEQPIGWGCLVGGTVLAAAGILWIDALAQQAES